MNFESLETVNLKTLPKKLKISRFQLDFVKDNFKFIYNAVETHLKAGGSISAIGGLRLDGYKLNGRLYEFLKQNEQFKCLLQTYNKQCRTKKLYKT